MAINVNEQILQANKAAFDHYQAVTLAALEGLSKLSNLNAQTARSSIEGNLAKVNELLSAKDPKAIADLAALAKPAAEMAGDYAKQAYGIASDTGAEIADLLQKQVAESRRRIDETVSGLAANAPAGTEPMVAFFKQAMTAANSAFDQINAAARQAAAVAQSGVNAATQAAGKARK